ncbi:MAG TPA: efflux RND transporter periplasmic adaptor subunit [Syntrophales bacterium]|nr:efflux RND transporter periplasmic adaptor subunit [Syntrophales bacterium]
MTLGERIRWLIGKSMSYYHLRDFAVGTAKWLLFSITFAVIIHGCASKEKPAMPPAPVTVASAVAKTVPVQINAVGNVEPCQTISVKAQITGQITKVNFREGQDVRKGYLLFELDCRPYVEALKQAEANLARDTAQAKNAEVDLQRYTALLADQFVTRQQYDQVSTNWAALEATLKADKAVVENSRVQIQYCSIYSPIDGRTGSLKVNQGNILKANDVEVVVVNQIEPIYVTFAIPEKDLPAVKKYQSQGKLKVEAMINGDPRPETGVLTFIDNAVNKATGTITLKGTFVNREKRLWPGQFVSVVLTLTSMSDAIVVPSRAVDTGQSGQYVFVIKPDLTAEMRSVTIGSSIGGETVILKGLQVGEQVVTDGQLRLIPGAKVTIKETP